MEAVQAQVVLKLEFRQLRSPRPFPSRPSFYRVYWLRVRELMAGAEQRWVQRLQRLAGRALVVVSELEAAAPVQVPRLRN